MFIVLMPGNGENDVFGDFETCKRAYNRAVVQLRRDYQGACETGARIDAEIEMRRRGGFCVARSYAQFCETKYTSTNRAQFTVVR